jgi:hypothetical protein
MAMPENRLPPRHGDTEVSGAVFSHAFNGGNEDGFLCASVPLWLKV